MLFISFLLYGKEFLVILKSRIRKVFTGLSLLLFSAFLFSQETSFIWEDQPLSADPQRVLAQVSKIPVDSGLEIQVLFESEYLSFDEQGRKKQVSYQLYRVLGQRGADGWDTLSASYAPWNENKPSLEARIILPDASVKTLDPETVLDGVSSGSDDKIYSDRRILEAPLPGIAPGVLVETRVIREEREPDYAFGTVRRLYVGNHVPVYKSRITLDAPVELSLRYGSMLMQNSPQYRTENGRKYIVYEASQLAAWEALEPYMPSDLPRYPCVIYTTGSTWQNLATSYSAQIDSILSSVDLKDQALAIVKDAPTNEAKIAALVQWMAKEIRYTGIEFGESALIPHSPELTLSRKYGDCKDKSCLMVAFLRSLGFKANLALLKAGPGADVHPSYPGMGAFDHAIVYVDEGAGYWIDTTDTFAPLGALPLQDQGRFILVASSETKGLVMSPRASSKENSLHEERTYVLKDYGYGDVQEISHPLGSLESSYRAFFAYRQEDGRRKWAENYGSNEYMSDTLNTLEISDPLDFSTPFKAQLTFTKAKRAYTDLESAIVYIRYESLFDRLPEEILKIPEAGDKERKADWLLSQAYSNEYRYTIVPPEGFKIAQVPAAQKLALGPALLEERFSLKADGSLQVFIRFDTIKQRYTPQEGLELARRVKELSSKPALNIQMVSRAKVLFDQGKPKDAFDAYRNLIEKHPENAVYRLRYAQALLKVGLGKLAREEAKTACDVSPDSSIAWTLYSQILRHDLVGQYLEKGADIPGARQALEKVLELDPEDTEAKANLAILWEYNDSVTRYESKENLAKALALYKELGSEECTNLGVANNPLYDAYYHGDYAQVFLETQRMKNPPQALQLAALSLLKDPDAAYEFARQKISDEASRAQALQSAGEMLMKQRDYEKAAALYSYGAYGNTASQIQAFASILKNLKLHETYTFNSESPEAAVLHLLAAVFQKGTQADLKDLISPRLLQLIKEYSGKEDSFNQDFSLGSLDGFTAAGFSSDLALDLLISLLDIRAEGSDEEGWNVRLRVQGADPLHLIVLKEEGSYKILGDLKDGEYLALMAIQRAEDGNLSGARTLLNWLREEQTAGSSEDPLSGALFPRYWKKNQTADKAHIQAAAASLLVYSSFDEQKLEAFLLEGIKSADQETAVLDASILKMALVSLYYQHNEFTKALVLLKELQAAWPLSHIVLVYNVYCNQGAGNFDVAEKLANDKLKQDPHDAFSLIARAQNSVLQDKYEEAQNRYEAIADSGEATEYEYNNLAWNSLFVGALREKYRGPVLKALSSERNNAAPMHTLACLLLEENNIKDAYQILVQCINLDPSLVNDDAYIYAFARLAEKCGLADYAKTAYKTLQKPKELLNVAHSSWKLAQMHLAQLP